MPSYHASPDIELASLLQTGDRVAFAEIFDRYYELLFIHAYKRLADEDQAKDIVQELFEHFWSKREQIQINVGLAPYLYASLRNRILNHLQSQKAAARRIASLGTFIEQDEYSTDYMIREKQMVALIEKEISSLPPKMREIFELSRMQHLSHRQIAERLDISEHTVRTQVKRALKVLKSRLGTPLFIIFLMKF